MFAEHAFVEAKLVGIRECLGNIGAGEGVFPGLHHGADMHGVRNDNVQFHVRAIPSKIRVESEQRKQFFFEKKNQKTFVRLGT
jgi:hypothetical protein